MFYNFARVHESLRCTPVMAIGIADRVWSDVISGVPAEISTSYVERGQSLRQSLRNGAFGQRCDLSGQLRQSRVLAR